MSERPAIEYSVLSTPEGYVTISRINRQGYPWEIVDVEPSESDRGPWALADELSAELETS